MIKLLIADDHQVLLDGFLSIFDGSQEFQVVKTVSNGEEVLQALEQDSSIEAILMDINMPKLNGVEACKKVKKKYPQIKVIALSMYNKHSYINRMLKSGADGYILKSTNTKEIIKGIKQVMAGEKFISFEVMSTLLNGSAITPEGEIPPITKRELEVLELIAAEYTTKEIAKKLFLSFETIQTHRKHLIQKFNAKNMVGVVSKATDKGII